VRVSVVDRIWSDLRFWAIFLKVWLSAAVCGVLVQWVSGRVLLTQSRNL